jgi:hypothetical protein
MPSYLEIALRTALPLNAKAHIRTEATAFHASEPSSEPQPSIDIARCSSPNCGGCYLVDPATGARIHPPKCGEDYRARLERWEAKGRVQ